jgi:hypothetical protein
MIEVPQTLLQALHDYLMSKPMIEVEQLVVGIRQCKPITPKE